VALKTFQLVLSATPKRLSDVYGGVAGVPDPTKDIPYRQIGLVADGADCFFGGDNTVSPTNWGAKGAIAATPNAAFPSGGIGPFPTGAVRLSDIWAVGAGSTVHIWAVPF
jgi:hypothetical protein